MTSELPPALVVDDEPVSRTVLGFALAEAGFACEFASDGNEALAKFGGRSFALLVTDLCMPGRNGHSLAVEVLARPDAPIVAVHTSVDDPRLVADLMARGVSDVVLKPSDYRAFAAKMKGLVARRRRREESPQVEVPGTSDAPDPGAAASGLGLVGRAELETRVREVAHLLPLSDAARDAASLLRVDECASADVLARIVERDAVLCCDVLGAAARVSRTAGQPAPRVVRDAIAVIGTRRLAEIAVAVGAFRVLARTVLPWLTPATVRLRGVAARLALDRIRAHSDEPRADGLDLAASVFPAARVLMGMLYPHEYRTMIDRCAVGDIPLSRLERTVFPASPAAALSELLSHWNVSAEITFPLLYAGESFAALSRLPRPVRGDVETLKLAIAVGECAVAGWHPWDAVEVPPAHLFDRLRIENAMHLVEEVRRDLSELPSESEESQGASATNGFAPRTDGGVAGETIRYVAGPRPEIDLFPFVLESMGFRLARGEAKGLATVANRVEAASSRSRQPMAERPQADVVLAAESAVESATDENVVVALPTSYSHLERTCRRAIVARESRRSG